MFVGAGKKTSSDYLEEVKFALKQLKIEVQLPAW